MMESPLTQISPSSAIFNSKQSKTVPTQPTWKSIGSTRETEITGEVSVKPYPSEIGIPAAQKTRDKRGCKAAEPEVIKRIFPPNASLHLLKINFR